MSAPTSPYRIEPGPRAAAIAVVGYSIVFIGTILTSGLAYDELFDSAENAWKSAVAGLAVGAVFLVAFVSWARWDHVWSEPGRLPMSRLIWLPAIVMVLGFVLRFAGLDWGAVDGGLLLAIIVAGIGVGFTEETLFRGIVLRSMRTGGRTEAQAALITALVFGLFHLTNIALGSGPAVVVQVFLATMSGFTLYLFRRGTGMIFASMAVHGLWDMSTFLSGNTALVNDDLPLDGASTALMFVNLVLIAVAWAATRKHDKHVRWQASGAGIAPGGPLAST